MAVVVATASMVMEIRLGLGLRHGMSRISFHLGTISSFSQQQQPTRSHNPLRTQYDIFCLFAGFSAVQNDTNSMAIAKGSVMWLPGGRMIARRDFMACFLGLGASFI